MEYASQIWSFYLLWLHCVGEVKDDYHLFCRALSTLVQMQQAAQNKKSKMCR